MSLQNRAPNQQRSALGQNNGKPQPLRAQPLKPVLPSIPEKNLAIKPDSSDSTKTSAAPKPPGQAKVPTLSQLREHAPGHKRQKILQDMVRTGGKENGFITFRDRPDNVDDIYAVDIGNEALVVAYVEHIYAYLYHREATISKDYMDGMSVNPRMRSILIDWIVSVAHRFKMCQDTLFLSLNIVDRFLSIPEIDATKDELQLIGVTAMFIAGKFEEVYPPELEDYVFISDHACTKPQILDCEMMMVNALNFDLTRPLPAHFLRRCCKAMQAGMDEYILSKYITELAQLHIDLVEVKASLIAAAAVYLAALLCRGPKNLWNDNMTYYSNYPEIVVKPVAYRLFTILRDAPNSKQQCIVKKYRSPKCNEVALISENRLNLAQIFFVGSP